MILRSQINKLKKRKIEWSLYFTIAVREDIPDIKIIIMGKTPKKGGVLILKAIAAQ